MLGLLLAIVPAAISAQIAQSGTIIRQRTDTLVTTRVDTVVVVRYDTIPAVVPAASPAGSPAVPAAVPAASPAGPLLPLDSVIAHAVRLGVQQALEQERQKNEGPERPRTAAERLWDRSQEKRHIERVKREDLKSTFIPKGQWMLGGAVNYQELDTDNFNLLVLKDVDIEGHTFSFTPYFGYFLANNIMLGGRYGYTRNYFYLGQFDLNLGEDFNISLSDLYYLAHTHNVSTFFRTYMPLGKSKMFGFFSEVRFGYAHSVGKNSTGTGADYDGSFDRSNSLQLTFCPGMTAFATDFLAAEVSIGVMGLKYSWKNQKTNRIEDGKVRSGGANFKFNLLSVNIGLTFYL